MSPNVTSGVYSVLSSSVINFLFIGCIILMIHYYADANSAVKYGVVLVIYIVC